MYSFGDFYSFNEPEPEGRPAQQARYPKPFQPTLWLPGRTGMALQREPRLMVPRMVPVARMRTDINNAFGKRLIAGIAGSPSIFAHGVTFNAPTGEGRWETSNRGPCFSLGSTNSSAPSCVISSTIKHTFDFRDGSGKVYTIAMHSQYPWSISEASHNLAGLSVNDVSIWNYIGFRDRYGGDIGTQFGDTSYGFMSTNDFKGSELVIMTADCTGTYPSITAYNHLGVATPTRTQHVASSENSGLKIRLGINQTGGYECTSARIYSFFVWEELFDAGKRAAWFADPYQFLIPA